MESLQKKISIFVVDKFLSKILTPLVMFKFLQFSRTKVLLLYPPGAWCNNIFEKNELKTVKVEALHFKMKPSKLLYDFLLRTYNNR